MKDIDFIDTQSAWFIRESLNNALKYFDSLEKRRLGVRLLLGGAK
jgi:hypothetical protein